MKADRDTVRRVTFLDHTFLCRWVSGEEAKVNVRSLHQVRWVVIPVPAECALTDAGPH